MERTAPRGNVGNREAVGVFDDVGNNGQHPLRRRRSDRTAQERDGGADIAVIVAVGLVLRRRRRAGTSVYTRDHTWRAAADVVDMHVTEGENELHREREQRQLTA